MGRSANGGSSNSQAKMIGGIAAVLIAAACSFFGINISSSGGSSQTNEPQATTQQTTSQDGSSSQKDSGSKSSSSSQKDSGSKNTESTQATSNLTFRNEERLQEHYEKHGIDMGFASAEDYLAAANAVVANPNALHKTESDDGDDVYYLEDTEEFVVVSKKGYIRTYYLANKDYYNRQ